MGLNPQGRDQTQEYQGIAGPLCLFPAWPLRPQSWRRGQHPATENNVPFTPCSVWMGSAGSVPAIPRRAFASPDGFVHSSGHGWGAFALGDASRLVVTGSRALSPAQALRERKIAVGFWPVKTDTIAHYFVLTIFSNT